MACEETAEAFNRQAVSAETQRLAPFAAIKRGVGNLAMGTAHAARATHATHHAGKVHAAHAAHTYVQTGWSQLHRQSTEQRRASVGRAQ